MGNLKDIRRRKMAEQDGRCFYCGLPMWDIDTETQCQPGENPAPAALRCTAEHLHPRSDGGVDRADNIVAACRFCNSHRHRRNRALSPDAYRAHVRGRMAMGRWLSHLGKPG